MSWDFFVEFLIVGERDYLFGTLYSFLPNTFLAFCTRHVSNQHSLFLAAWVRTFETALVTTHANCTLNFRHRASSILGQAFNYSPENAFDIFNQ